MIIRKSGSVGIVKTEYFTFANGSDALTLDSGERLGPVTLAYETYGRLNERRSNAVLVLHALSGDAHAAGFSAASESVSAAEMGLDGEANDARDLDHHRLGWWDDMIGPGLPFDTDKYFVICSNVIAGCRGSTGPASICPATGTPYGLAFPVVTIADMVRAQVRLIDHLGIDKLLAVAGGSMGGMQALQWAAFHPDRVRSAIPIATAARLSAQGIAFSEVGREAIMADPNWAGGNYYGLSAPNIGLAIARMVGHITYLSEESMRAKFGRRLRDKERYGYDFSVDFEVESYLRHQGDAFTRRFDANSYLYITKAIDYFDLAVGRGSLASAFKDTKVRFLLIAFTSDWLYPPSCSKEIVRAIKANRGDVSYFEVNSPYGHDAFLLEYEIQGQLISGFLSRTMETVAV